MRLQIETERAKELAILAGDILLKLYACRSIPSWKAPDDPVTAADKAAGDFLTYELHRSFKDDPILCEDKADDLSRTASSRAWIIDPMDGTREFIDYVGQFAILIGLAIEGTPCLGVVYQPTTKKLYFAARGDGAYLEQDGRVK